VVAENHLLLFPSIREFGGGVVLEAMAMGLAPLVVDYGGPGELVTDGTGFKVPLGERPAIVAALRAQLEHLAAAPGEVAEAGANGRAKVARDFTWAAKARQVATIYDWVLAGGRGPVPAPLEAP